jgi:hypothetical protein
MRRLAIAALGAVVLAACSLGLDESRIGGGTDAGAPDVFVPDDASAPDAPDTSVDGSTGLTTSCTKDDDCKGTDACLVGHCDLSRKTCAYDVCRPQACAVATCDPTARTCGATRQYTFKAAQFPVGAGVGCGGSASRCLAVVYPFVLVGTTNGVLAFSAADPSAATPTPVAVTGLAFPPTQLLASGNRIYFLGAQFGTGTSSRVPLAWIDVPVDPFAKSLVATSVLASWNKPAADPIGLAIGENGSAFLIDTAAASMFATAKVVAPLVEPLSLSAAALPITANTVPVATSASRFLMQLTGPPPSTTGVPSFGFINGVGTAGVANGGDGALSTIGPVSAAVQAFAGSNDGTVLWVAEALTAAPAPGPSFVKTTKAFFLVADGASNVDATGSVDLVTYPPAAPYVNNQALIGPAAILDKNTALVSVVNTGVAGPPFNQTDVMFVTKAPAGVVKNADNSVRKLAVPVVASALGAAASRGTGYVLASESPTAASVYVFDPGCAP